MDNIEIRYSKAYVTKYTSSLTKDATYDFLRRCAQSILTARGVRHLADMPAYIEAAEWLTALEGKHGLMLCGPVGCGKTILAKAVVTFANSLNSEYARFKDGSLRWLGVTPPEGSPLLSVEEMTERELYQLASTDFARYADIRKAQVLMLDDIGTEESAAKNYGNIISPMADVIAFRTEYQRMTVATTNLTTLGLRKKYGERFESRCAEHFKIINMEGKDLRR